MRIMQPVSSETAKLLLLGALWVITACGMTQAEAPPNRLTEAERRTGWRLLFNGHSADQFRGYRKESLGLGWLVQDSALLRRGPGAGDIVTKDTFDNFELQFEYRISAGGNSGVMFHVSESQPAPWMTGPEVQILDNAVDREGQKAGWLYGLYAPQKPKWLVDVEVKAGGERREMLDATRPAGEWNQVYLRVTPDAGELCLNGVSYYKFRKGDEDWRERVAKSKFAAFPEFGKAARGHICLQDHGDEVAFRSIKVRELSADGKPVVTVAEGELPVKAVAAFPNATWEGWSAETDDGRPAEPLHPLLVTHAGDGSGRRFVLDQSGMIHVVPRDLPQGEWQARLFLDIRTRTAPWDKANEEGLLGLAFHPRFRENGEFFICYCLKGEPQTEPRIERVSRFRVLSTDPSRSDPTSEEVVLELEQPLPNHNGGSIMFGLDGYLYVGLGDGGGRDDPLQTAQSLGTWLGKILRIDVDRRDPGKAYAVPLDNPFVGRAGARPEIFAYGFRNPWQISIDRQTGRLWTADVGQDLREEIDVVEKGGNYGWSLREGTGSFGQKTAGGPLIDPIWEYDHQIGKSITGGFVARGGAVPALEGGYLYGDYVSGKLWALWPNENPERIVNQSIPWNGLPIFGFGHDEAGAVYVLTSSATGQGVFQMVSAADGPTPSATTR
jgi:glucose/arabinose dehydrogenase